MNRSTTFVYCLDCQKLISVEQAHKIFKTGFYNISFPLAKCINCCVKKEMPRPKKAS